MSFEWLTDWLPFTFYYLMVLLLFLANLTSWVSILFLVPGNWIMVFLSALFYLFMPGRDEHGISLTVLVIAILLAGLGEVIEALGSSAGAAKKGASRRAMILALLGTFIASVIGAPGNCIRCDFWRSPGGVCRRLPGGSLEREPGSQPHTHQHRGVCGATAGCRRQTGNRSRYPGNDHDRLPRLSKSAYRQAAIKKVLPFRKKRAPLSQFIVQELSNISRSNYLRSKLISLSPSLTTAVRPDVFCILYLVGM